MSGFHYKNNRLCADDVPLNALAENYGTPVYVYSASQMEKNFNDLQNALKNALGVAPLIAFAVKANSNLAVLKTLGALGAGADVVSGGELTRALQAGIAADKIVFSGVGKTVDELRLALSHRIYQINVESETELDRLIALSDELRQDVPVVIRVNPNVDAKTHEKIATGKEENKFGINLALAPSLFQKAKNSKYVKANGVAVHIGSQLTDIDPFRQAFQRVADFVGELRSQNIVIDRVDLGGGLGITYRSETPPDLGQYAQAVADIIKPLNVTLTFEPGRFLVGNAGVLLSRVIAVKEGTSRKYLIVDAAMNDLARPTLYGAYHHILPVNQPEEDGTQESYDVVGPVCETGDTFALQRPLARMQENDLLALMTAGAYGAVMASMYNSRDLVAEVLVKGGNHALIRRRFTLAEQLTLETMPGWQ